MITNPLLKIIFFHWLLSYPKRQIVLCSPWTLILNFEVSKCWSIPGFGAQSALPLHRRTCVRQPRPVSLLYKPSIGCCCRYYLQGLRAPDSWVSNFLFTISTNRHSKFKCVQNQTWFPRLTSSMLSLSSPSRWPLVAQPQIWDRRYPELLYGFLYPDLAPNPTNTTFRWCSSFGSSTAAALAQTSFISLSLGWQ